MAPLLIPVFVGAGLTGTLFGVGTAAIAAHFVVAAVTLAATYGLSLLSRKRKTGSSASPAQTYQETIRQAVAPRRRSYGTVKVSGPMAFYEARGDFVYILVLMNSGTIESIEEFWIADRQVLLSSAGEVITEPFLIENQPQIFIEWALGFVDQGASPELMAEFDEWTSDHRLSGIAWTLMRLAKVKPEYFQPVYNNTTPSIRQVMRATRVYDPRSSSQSLADGASWRSSQNPTLQLLDYMTNKDGMWLARSQFNEATFIAQADVCDSLVPLRDGGVQARYESSGTYELTDAPTEVIDTMLSTCGGLLYLETDGLIGMEVDQWYEPEDVITERDILRYDIGAGVGRMQGYRAIRAKFTSIVHSYKEQSTGVVTLPGLNPGDPIVQDFDIPWVTSNAQALRLAKAKLYRDNPEFSGTLTLGPTGLRLLGRRRFRLTTPTLFNLDHVCEVKRWSVSSDLSIVKIDFISLSEEGFAWDPETEEQDAPPVPPDTSETETLAAPTNVRARTGLRGAVMWAGISWDNQGSGETAEVRYKLTADPDWTYLSTTTDNFVEWSGLTTSSNYTAQVRLFDQRNNVTTWVQIAFTATDDQTVPSVPSGLAAVGSVELVTASAIQSAASVAFVVEFFADDPGVSSPSFSPVNFTRGASLSQGTGDIEFWQPDGSRKVWARSRTVADKTSTVIGPVTITVGSPPAPPTGGTSGSGGSTGDPGGSTGTGGGTGGTSGGSSGDSGHEGGHDL